MLLDRLGTLGAWSRSYGMGGFKLIGHFRVPLCLCFNASLSAKPFLWTAWKWYGMQNIKISAVRISYCVIQLGVSVTQYALIAFIYKLLSVSCFSFGSANATPYSTVLLFLFCGFHFHVVLCSPFFSEEILVIWARLERNLRTRQKVTALAVIDWIAFRWPMMMLMLC